MSISRRTAFAVRSLGVASAAGALALGVAGSAFACAAADFTGTAECQQSSGNALLTIKDSDNSNTHATVEIDYKGQKVGSVEFHKSGDTATTQTVVVPWETSGKWTLNAQASGRDFRGQRQNSIPVPGGDCGTPVTPPSQSASASASASAPASESASASASASSSAPVVVPTSPSASSSAVASTSASPSSTVEATSSPSASTAVEATASPTGTQLASTGGGSDAGLFAGIGAVLVAAGGATVFFLRRRSAGTHA